MAYMTRPPRPMLVFDSGAVSRLANRQRAAALARQLIEAGISLPGRTHARAVEHACSTGTTLSGLIDEALRAELMCREVADHVTMLAEADDADRLHARARARSRALSAWKSGR